MQLQKSEIISAVVTAIITALLILFLCLFGMMAMRDVMDEGVEIAFGTEDGFGEQVPSPLPTTSPEPTTTTPAAPTPNPEELLTQDNPSVVMTEEERRKEKERNEEMAEQQRIEQERIKQEEAERKAEEERQRQEQIRQEKASKAAALTGSAFTNKGNGSGETSGDSQKGNPAGIGKSPEGVTGLNGRSLTTNRGRLIEPPYPGNQQGRVVIDIVVDSQGRVTSATINVGKTTIGDNAIRNQAIAAARKNRFSTIKGTAVAKGTITFNYKIK